MQNINKQPKLQQFLPSIALTLAGLACTTYAHGCSCSLCCAPPGVIASATHLAIESCGGMLTCLGICSLWGNIQHNNK